MCYLWDWSLFWGWPFQHFQPTFVRRRLCREQRSNATTKISSRQWQLELAGKKGISTRYRNDRSKVSACPDNSRSHWAGGTCVRPCSLSSSEAISRKKEEKNNFIYTVNVRNPNTFGFRTPTHRSVQIELERLKMTEIRTICSDFRQKFLFEIRTEIVRTCSFQKPY